MSSDFQKKDPYKDIFTDQGVVPRDKGYGKKVDCRWFVNPGPALFCLIFVLGMLILAINMAAIGRPGSGAIFFLLSVPFYWYLFLYGSTLSIDDSGVHLRFLWIERQSLRWEEVAQIGIAGKKVFNKHNPKKTGGIFIYFSRTELDDEQCFQMMLKWPQASVMFLKFNHDRFRRIQAFHTGAVQRYNVGKMFFG